MCILTAPFPGKSEFIEETVLRAASPTPTHQGPSQPLSNHSVGQGAQGLGLVLPSRGTVRVVLVAPTLLLLCLPIPLGNSENFRER